MYILGICCLKPSSFHGGPEIEFQGPWGLLSKTWFCAQGAPGGKGTVILSCNDGAGGDGGDEESYGCLGDHSVIPC